jgi:hypothetical protein
VQVLFEGFEAVFLLAGVFHALALTPAAVTLLQFSSGEAKDECVEARRKSL